MSMPSADGATPAMSQWFGFKAEHPEALLFFRMGDFYELFFADAEAAAQALGIQLTYRGEHAGSPIPMCGVPVHAAENYLSRLIRRKFRVAVVEQMEPPRKGKAPIRRAVVRLVTPGTLTEDALLDAGRPNLLVALTGMNPIGAAWMDISTGLFETAACEPAELPALLARLDPAELIADPALTLGDWEGRRSPPRTCPTPAAARQLVADAYAVNSLAAFGQFTEAEIVAAALAINYVRMTQSGKLPRLAPPMPVGEAGLLRMDAATRASLDLTMGRDGTAQHTLLGAIDHTLSTPGCRLLSAWLHAPLQDVADIALRQDRWAWLIAQADAAQTVRAALHRLPDMHRALGRLALGRCVARDLAAIRDGLDRGFDAAQTLRDAPPFATLIDALLAAPDLRAELTRALNATDAVGIVATGYDGELDAERQLRDDSRRLIAARQLDYAQEFGVASLKIRHHAQLGYVIEVPSAAAETLRAHPSLQLRQGLANGARFTHPDLSELDRRIGEAAERAERRERAILDHLLAAILAQAAAIADCAAALAQIDVAQSAAKLAAGGRWCRPVVSDDDQFVVIGGRHPVVEAGGGKDSAFIANDCDLSADRRVLLLTGPNMAGKSTYLRQNAIVAILAQAGLPVPATSARIGTIDRLFSRVGASDDLARGRSTFMVEMIETAAILHQAGPRSLVVVDEIGRGTATLDGLAIAWAALEGLHFRNRCRTIFATHFHELGQVGGTLTRLRAHTMRVIDWQGDIRFLHEVAAGAAGRSWGVHVAKLAGVPAPTLRRAEKLLAELERSHALATPALPLFAAVPTPESASETAEEAWPPGSSDPLHDALAGIDPDRLTPREALDALFRLKAIPVPDRPHAPTGSRR